MTNDLSALRDHVLATVTTIIADKESRSVIPAEALKEEIYNAVKTDVQKCLNAFVKDGILGFHRTLNSVSFHFKPAPIP